MIKKQVETIGDKMSVRDLKIKIKKKKNKFRSIEKEKQNSKMLLELRANLILQIISVNACENEQKTK